MDVTAFRVSEEGEESRSSVTALTGAKSFRSLVQRGDGTFSLERIGIVGYRDYETARTLRALFFIPDNTERAYPLGQASSSFQIIDHGAALEPLMDLGFQPRMVKMLKGGARLFTVLEHPMIRFPYPISWDGLEETGREPLSLAVSYRGDARVGHSLSLTFGFFRRVCVNGLISEVLMLGHSSWSHIHFSAAEILVWIQNQMEQFDPDDYQMKLTLYPSPTLAELERMFLRLSDPDEREAIMDRTPAFVTTPYVKMEQMLSQSGLLALRENLQAITTSQATFTLIDLLNAITNVPDEGGARRYFLLERLLRPLLYSIELAQYKLA